MIKIKFYIFIIFLALLHIENCYAESVSSKNIIENARVLDGKRIEYRGEVVTSVLKRGEYAWINLNDGDNAIGIWCKKSDIDFVRFAGDYKHKGDILEVTGVFNRACSEHGGEMDIHADSVSLILKGHFIKEKVSTEKMKLALELFLIIILIIVIYRKRLS